MFVFFNHKVHKVFTLSSPRLILYFIIVSEFYFLILFSSQVTFHIDIVIAIKIAIDIATEIFIETTPRLFTTIPLTTKN